MKKGLLAVLAAGMLALVMASTPVVSAAETEPLRGEMTLSIDLSDDGPCVPEPGPDCFWSGTISGDVAGTIEVREVWEKNYYSGLTEHFFETFKISVGPQWISGEDQGLWNMGTLKFRANGWVTDASPGLAYLNEYKLHEMGSVTIVDGIATATASWFLIAP